MVSDKKKYFPSGIKRRDVAFLILFYFSFALLYHIVLWYNRGGFASDGFFGFLDFKEFWFTAGMPYSFYLITSIIIWLAGRIVLKKWNFKSQAVFTFFAVPICIYFVREGRYILIDYLELGRLTGTGEVWDWYIPVLFLYIQFGFLFAYQYFIETQQKLKTEAALKQLALQSELSAIKAQLNPHFLYNIFNTINASVPPENEKTRQMIAQLADMFRYQLQASQKELVYLSEEVDFVLKYLDLERERFGDRLNIEIDIAEDLYSEKIPPMMLQPLVENSVKHGLSSLIDGGTIAIKIYKEEQKLRFIISDTGVGAKDKKALFGKGIGLTNTKLRLQKMYNASLEIEDNLPKWKKAY